MGDFSGLGSFNFKHFVLVLPSTTHNKCGKVPELWVHGCELVQWGSLVRVEGAVIECMFSSIFQVVAVGAG